jgi:uncharacterized membrane protein YqjE
MAHERLKDAALPHALSDVITDFADLIQKELRLAKAELSAKISHKINFGICALIAGFLALMAAFILVQSIILTISSYGIALHLSCLIVATGLAVLAAIAFLIGRADAKEDLTPHRSIHQVKRDVATVKEQLT